MKRDHAGMLRAEPSVSHAKGERCPVVDLLYSHFGNHYGHYLLLEFTCFPMSDDHAMVQAQNLVNADEMYRLGKFLRLQARVQEKAMGFD